MTPASTALSSASSIAVLIANFRPSSTSRSCVSVGASPRRRNVCAPDHRSRAVAELGLRGATFEHDWPGSQLIVTEHDRGLNSVRGRPGRGDVCRVDVRHDVAVSDLLPRGAQDLDSDAVIDRIAFPGATGTESV